MPKQFCQSCGTGTAYEISRPKFCCNCGNSFLSAASVSVKVAAAPPPPARRRPAPPPVEPEYFDDEEEFSPLPAVTNIFDSTPVIQRATFTIGDVVENQMPIAAASSGISTQGKAACRKLAKEMERLARDKTRKSTEIH